MKKAYLFALILVWVLNSANVFAQTQVSDTVKTNDVWQLGNSPYQITSDVIVDEGVTLTIEAGVEVQFDAGTSLIVDGALVADGTATDSVLFTSSSASPAPGDWVTIRFNNTSDVGSVLDHAILEYGGSGSGGSLVSYATGAYGFDITNSEFKFSNRHGIALRASSPFIQYSVFRDNAGYGIYSDLALNYEVDSSTIIRNTQGGIRVPINSAPTITSSTIDTNGVGIYMDNGSTAEVRYNNIRENNTGVRVIEAGTNSPIIEDNTFGNNSNWALINEGSSLVEAEYNYWGKPTGPTAISNPTGTGDDVSSNIDFDPWLSGSGTLPVKEITSNPLDGDVWTADTVYVIANGITLPQNDTLTIAPGTAVKFQNQVSFEIDGTLIADGKPDSVIVFTSLKSDIYGGDTNQDARNSKPAPGDWRGLDLTDYNTGSIFDFVNVSYAGYSSTPALKVSQNNVSLSNMFLDNNNDIGIQISGVPTVFRNIVSNANNSHGIQMRNITADLDSVEASYNQGNGIYYESDADNTGATLSISNSVFNENNKDGIFVDDRGYNNWTNQPALDSLTNTEIRFNGRQGLSIEEGWGSSLYIADNTFEANSRHGVTVYHASASEDSLHFHNNVFLNNGRTGIRTTSARFTDNTFDGNEFGIGYWGHLGYNYLNQAGQDNNTFTNNTYNNSLELYSNNLQDTLSNEFPEEITSGVYMFKDIGDAVQGGNTLVIEPGVIIKIGHSNDNDDFRVDNSTLIAKGTQSDPIVFTSYRDHNYGGKTNALSDTNSAQPGDWRHVYLDGNNNPTNTKFTEFEHVIFQYGDQNIRAFFDNDNSIQNTWSHIESRYADSYLELQNTLLTLENATIENHRLEGIRLENRNDGGLAELTLRNSVIRNNGHHGIQTTGYLADHAILKEISNSVIEGNGQNGIYQQNPTAAITLLGNTIQNNSGHGVALFHKNMTLNEISFVGNIVKDNGRSGILSSQAKFIDNTFEGNEFGIGHWGKLGSRFVDENGDDGNTFTDNTYNNAQGLYARELSDTLSIVFPEEITSSVYMFEDIGDAVENGDRLVIDPGVIIKIGHDGNNDQFRIDDSILEAKGTENDPIVFTSYRDHNFGGKTNALSDTNSAKPDDWRELYLDGNSNPTTTKFTELEHVIIQYGDHNIRTFFDNDNSIQNTWSHIESRYADSYLEFQNTLLTLENATIEDHNQEGIRLENRNDGGLAELILRNSVVRNNGDHGIQTTGYLAPNAIIREMTNSVIEGNGEDGIRSPNGASPMTFQFNSIHNNQGNGIYASVSNAGTDTVLTISGNYIHHNGGTGILSSRAIIVDDTLQHNNIPIGVIGELSKPGTVNDQGNFYQGNVITDNNIDSVISVAGTIRGVLGGSWPQGYNETVLIANSENTDLDLNSGDSLVVAPGTIFKGRDNNDINIEGTLVSVGEEDNKIIFTSFKDDTFGGNTNRDTTDVIPEPRDWRGFDIRDAGSDSSFIKNTIIRYADDNLYLDNTEIIIDSSFVSYAYDNGIRVIGGANPIIRSSDIHHNDTGIDIDNNSNPFIHLNNIYDNDRALYQDAGTDVIAENNYWGASTGPFVDTGPDLNTSGTGNEIYVQNGTVDYRPFHSGRNGILLGDVTENGNISAFDASLVLQHTVGSNTLTGNALAAADVSANGNVSALDAAYILQYVVGNISGFPGQGKRNTPDYTEAITLNYQDESGYTDIDLRSTGEADIHALEMDIVIGNNPVSEIEMVTNGSKANFNIEYAIEADTIRVALAASKAVEESADLGALRLIYNDDADVSGTKDRITYQQFIVNEADITEFMNANYTSTDELADIPERFDLKQNYPNPFNPTTNIAYDLPQAGEVKLQVYNMLGQLVQTVVNKRQKAGSYTLKWDAARYSSGTYLLRIDFTGEDNTSYSEVRKMLLIK